MSKTLVSILSDHSVPNYLFIKEMAGKYNDLLFITTDKVEKNTHRSIQLENTLLKEENSVRRIVVDSDDYHLIKEKIEKENLSDDVTYIVNLTGGTKMMSLAVHDYFVNKKSEFYYIPIGKNQYYNLTTNEKFPLEYRATLMEYFMLYGLKYVCDNTLLKDKSVTLNLFNNLKANDFVLIKKMRASHRQSNNLSTEDRRYYAGAWFEEYTYLRIKKQFALRDDDIAMSVKIFRNEDDNNNDNELDVAFVHDNVLNVIECKVNNTPDNEYKRAVSKQQKIEEYLYKLAAISKDFGLQVSSYLFCLYKFDTLSEATQNNIKKRCKILGVRKIIGPSELSKSEIEL